MQKTPQSQPHPIAVTSLLLLASFFERWLLFHVYVNTFGQWCRLAVHVVHYRICVEDEEGLDLGQVAGFPSYSPMLLDTSSACPGALDWNPS